MKKLIALLMVSAFAFAFVACGGEKKAESEDATNTETPAVESDTTTEADTTEVDTTGVQ
jgi:hypothetical protein